MQRLRSFEPADTKPLGWPHEVADVADDQISPAARALIDRHLATMDHVQLLLHLHHAPDGAHVNDMATALGLEERAASRALDDLVSGGLVERDPQTGRHRCVPHSDATRSAVDALEMLYNTRPVTLVRLIYNRPPTALRSFSEAFRLRKPDSDQ